MDRGDSSQIDLLEELSNTLDSAGYHSLLMVYHAKMKDNWIKAARVLNKNHKLKYMPAIRTYAITPEYAAMISKAFEEIAPNRLMLNIVSGDIHPDEDSINNLIWFKDSLDTPEKRLKYTDEWIAKFLELSQNSVSEIVMGGHSLETKLMANKYNAIHLSMVDAYLNIYKNKDFIKNNKQMLSLSILVRENQNDAEDFVNKFLKNNEKQWTLYGDKQSVKTKIKEIFDSGATDIIIAKNINDTQSDLIHDIIKEIMEEQNGIN
jgi:alkanesulfonate monooxygenase SsuD/methylene tetrahydromethanopterin reductase-like flavin-dependent oxidoreductase (luciferase family)